jgi:hypothetical protein
MLEFNVALSDPTQFDRTIKSLIMKDLYTILGPMHRLFKMQESLAPEVHANE